MISNIFLFLLWFLIWSLLSWPPGAQDLVIGAVVSVFVTIMTVNMPVAKRGLAKKPFGWMWFVYYAAVFAWECLKGNIDVAYRVIHPHLPIRPGTVKVKTSLTSDIGLTFLANSITLTPGTTTIDIDRDNGILYVHRLYLEDGWDSPGARPRIVDKFEKILKRIFE